MDLDKWGLREGLLGGGVFVEKKWKTRILNEELGTVDPYPGTSVALKCAGDSERI